MRPRLLPPETKEPFSGRRNVGLGVMLALETNILDEMVRRLVAEFQPQQIILFGSYAWGEPNDTATSTFS